MKENIRIRDVADMAGVSIGAVSRALKGQSGISEKQRKNIISVAQKLGYDLSRLQGNKLKRILFILHRQHNTTLSLTFYTPLLMEIEDACRESDIALSFLALGPSDEIEKRVRQHMPDGLLVVGFFEQDILTTLSSFAMPMVLIDLFNPHISSVNPDNVQGGAIATRHLISSGRRRIAFLASSLSHYSIQQRLRGYRQELFDAGILTPPDYEAVAPDYLPTEQGLEEAVKQLIGLSNPPDAIFAYNDAAALIAVRTCKNLGLKVPEDIAIIGFDDIDNAALSDPSLSSIRVNRQLLGQRGLELLLNDRTGQHELIGVELRARASTLQNPEGSC